MILLDDVHQWYKRARKDTYFQSLSDAQLEREITALFSGPIEHHPDTGYGVFFKWYFAEKWTDALAAVKCEVPMKLYEVAPGSNIVIPQTVARLYVHPETVYVTSNVDKKLTASFKKKTADLPIAIEVIEDAAQNIEQSVDGGFFDVVAFEHSVNDVLYAMLGERAGLDVATSYWFDIVQQLTDIITAEYVNGTLESSAKSEFLGLMQSCLHILKPGGCIVINHFMYGNDLKRGIDPVLWENLLPIVRAWIHTLDGGSEISVAGFNPQWWMFFQKK